MQDRIFHSICFGFVFGVLLRSFVLVDFYLTILLGFVSFALVLFFTLISKDKWGIIISVFVLTFCLGIFRFHMADVAVPAVSSAKIELTGIIVDEPDIRENNQKLIVKIPENIKIIITTDFTETFKYGDEIKIEGGLELPENFITDQGKEFDYINYLRKDGILYVMSYPEIEIISHGNGNKIKSALFDLKEKFLGKMNMAIPLPESLLMGGLIVGEKAAFSQDLRQSFVDTGTIHIVALSGYNVTIVAEWLMKLFKYFFVGLQNLGISVGILTIFLFIIMTGGSSTAIRAGIMATLALIARATGRNYDVARALILAGVGMILLNPFILAYDVSFQLSFIATVAVIFVAPKVEKYFQWVTTSFKLRDIISVTCAVYIFVLPFILYKMGNLSIVALPANILILPFIPWTMGLGFLTGLAGMLSHILAVPLGFISSLLLNHELGVISFFANLSFAAFSIPNFPLILTLLIYAYFCHMLFGGAIKEFFRES